MSLANKYRPRTFDDIIGQDHITTILKAQMKSEKGSHHNYIFFGPRGTGKTSVARVLAKSLNCLNLQDGNPCNECDNCITIHQAKTLDYIEIDAASHTGVDNVREEIIDKINYPPTHLKKKVYVIDEVHMLSKGAFNALLKTIEEPKDNMCFILATTEIHKIPDTIISRCQVFNVRKVIDEYMITHLKKIADAEKLPHQEEALVLITRISEGCVRDAIKYIDQISVLGEINTQNVSKMLGVASETVVQDFLQKIKQGNQDEVFAIVDELAISGIDLAEFAKQTLMYIDQYLHQDTSFFLTISKYISEILSKIKYYPYPKIIYKIAINEYLQLGSMPAVGVTQQPVDKVTTSTQTTTEDPEKQKEIVLDDGASETLEKQGQPMDGLDKKNSDNQKTLEQLVKKLGSENLSLLIQKHVKIKEILDNKVIFLIINKVTEIAINKKDNLVEIENILSEILGQDVFLELEYQSKEDFFKQGLM